jgi:hypothetical protein
VPREVTHRYEDPLDRIWIGCAERVGLRVTRDPSAFATTDGRGTLALSTAEGLDRDDCLAQMIFHELCHSLVMGPRSFYAPDWGLDNEAQDLLTGKDATLEHACLRLQALLLRPLGLRRVLAPTTDFRAYYDALPEDPLEGDDPAIPIAIAAAGRVSQAPWVPHVEEALAATAEIARATHRYVSKDTAKDSLWARVEAPVENNAAGLPLAAPSSRAASHTCGTCVWARRVGSKTTRCLHARVPTKTDAPACERWEGALDCHACGACCREAFHTVLLRRGDLLRKKRPDLVTMIDGKPEMPRPDGLCPALAKDPRGWACTVYEDRPTSCRDFAMGGEACLTARRRVGLAR